MAHDYGEAFKIYEEMGEKRSLKVLSERTNIPLSTLKKVSAKEGWAFHLNQENSVAAKEQIEKVVVSEAMVGQVIDGVKFREYISKLVLLADKALEEGQIKFRTISDLVKVYQLQLDMVRLSKDYEIKQQHPHIDNLASGFEALAKAREEIKKREEEEKKEKEKMKKQEETNNDNDKIQQHFN